MPRVASDPFVARLSALCEQWPTRAKWVFVPSHGMGRMLGDRLVLGGRDWTNLRFVTPFDLALRMGAPFLVERGVDPSEEGLGPALMMRLLLGLPEGTSYFRPLADQPQMAVALWSTVRDVRMAGLRSTDLRADAFASADKYQELAALLGAYEAFLDRERRGDRATVFTEALAHREWCPIQPHDCWLLWPDVVWSSLERRLLQALPGERLAVPPTVVPGIALPRRLSAGPNPEPGTLNPEPGTRNRIEFFHSGGAEAEVEEVFRRVLSAGTELDTVEIACASDRYPALIWEKALRYEWPVTLADGIPAALTRPGRALLGLADWIEDDFAAGRLRRLLQSGDVTLGDAAGLSPGRAARLLVKAQAAWGRDTYRRALGRMARSERTRATRDDVAADERERGMARALEADALAGWISALVDAVPAPDEQGQVDLQAVVDCAEQFVAKASAAASALDRAAATRLGQAIGELRMLDGFRCSIGRALRFVRERVETLRVGGDRARPGHLYVSSLRDCGLAGRPHVYVVGLEEGRVFPATFEDPILLDEERAAIDPGLGRSADAVDEAVHAALARLDTAMAAPEVSLCASYSCRDLREFRETYASWVMLRLFRQATGDPSTSYQDLRQHLGPPVSCVPAVPDRSLGPGRWWLQAVTRAGVEAGKAAVTRQFPPVAAGMAAEAARESEAFTEFDGHVPAAGTFLDPCAPAVVVSPTQLEQAAECPFRYFLRRGLKVEAIETGERDRDLWLDPLIRGSLLHDLYAALLRRCRDGQRQPSLAADRQWLQQAGQQALDDLQHDMPPPSLEVKDRESREFLADLELFLAGEIEIAAQRTPVALEVAFGRSGADTTEPLSMDEPITMRLGSLTLRVAGRVDRIDRLADGRFEILDYKTGGFWPDKWRGTFAGGRRLQHALYGLAAIELLKRCEKKPVIAGAQYYFSSAKGRQERKVIPVAEPALVGRLLEDLREVITSGLFVHAPDEDDCRFCHYGPACGAGAAKRAKGKLADPALGPYRRLAAYE